MKNKIFLTKEGYDQLLVSIDKLYEQLKKNNIQKSKAYDDGVGDGWHDNFDFEEAVRNEFLIMNEIKEKRNILNNVEIIEDSDKNDDVINLEDIFKIRLFFEDDDYDDCVFKLVGKYNVKEYKDYQEISLNSPLGISVYKKEINKEFEYQVDDKRIIKATILEKIKI